MEGLIARKPLLTVMMLVGILGMFLAPFGMLISKYATLRPSWTWKGSREAGFSSPSSWPSAAPPPCFSGPSGWESWSACPATEVSPEGHIPGGEWFALGLLAVFTFFACVFFAPIAGTVIDPYVQNLYGSTASLATDTLVIMMIMMGVLFLLPVLYLVFPREQIYAPGIPRRGQHHRLGQLSWGHGSRADGANPQLLPDQLYP
jgi:ech hydrogenase subunit A